MICKARSCAQLTGMIDADLVPIAHVLGSFQLGRVSHEMITCTTLGNMAAETHTVHVNIHGAGQNSRALLLRVLRSVRAAAPANRRPRVQAYVGRERCATVECGHRFGATL